MITYDSLKAIEFQKRDQNEWNKECPTNLGRFLAYQEQATLINVLSLITVQGVTLFYKKFKVSSGLGLFPFLRS